MQRGKRYTMSKDGIERTTIKTEIRVCKKQWEVLNEAALERGVAVDDMLRALAYDLVYRMQEEARERKRTE